MAQTLGEKFSLCISGAVAWSVFLLSHVRRWLGIDLLPPSLPPHLGGGQSSQVGQPGDPRSVSLLAFQQTVIGNISGSTRRCRSGSLIGTGRLTQGATGLCAGSAWHVPLPRQERRGAWEPWLLPLAG